MHGPEQDDQGHSAHSIAELRLSSKDREARVQVWADWALVLATQASGYNVCCLHKQVDTVCAVYASKQTQLAGIVQQRRILHTIRSGIHIHISMLHGHGYNM